MYVHVKSQPYLKLNKFPTIFELFVLNSPTQLNKALKFVCLKTTPIIINNGIIKIHISID